MIAQLWIIFAVLTTISSLFFLMPWIKSRRDYAVTNNNHAIAENVRLFNEQIIDLENQKKTGRITAEEFQSIKIELEQNLLQSASALKETSKKQQYTPVRWAYISLALVFAVSVFLLYKHLGAATDLHIIQLQKAKIAADTRDMRNNKMPDLSRANELITELENKLERQPENLQYWFLLARLSSEQNDYAKAVNAYQQIMKYDQSSSLVVAELAQAMFLRDKHVMSDEIGRLTADALNLDPQNTTALGLSGIFSFSKKNYIDAIRYWQQAVNLLGENSESGIGLSLGIEKAKNLYLAEGGTQESLEKALAPKAIVVQVNVDPKISVPASQLVYVYAREWQGSKMPLAITRISFSQLPTKISLTESMAMSPSATLATASQVEVVARISQDGTAMAKPGDWQAIQGPFDMDKLPETIDLVIDKQFDDGSGEQIKSVEKNPGQSDNKTEIQKKITLDISIDPSISVKPDQVVYVYARAWQGSKMPLAITPVAVSQFPTQITLTEAMAMSPSATLATASQIEVVARISQDGTAMAKPGDWQASQGPLDINKLPEKISLVINKKID